MAGEFKSFLKTVKGNEGDKCHYSTRLDTYGCGCQHDCKYCYAKSLLSFRGLWDSGEPKAADIKKIRRAVAKLPKDKPVRLGGMTDCFMPQEKELRVTLQTLEALNEYRVPYLIVTKSAMIAEEPYISTLDPKLAHVQVSVTCTDDSRAGHYEKASPPSKRMEAIGRLHDRGIDVALRLSPFIPQYIDFSVLEKVNTDKIIVEFLRVNHWIKQWFDIDYSEYSLKQSGYEHLPLERKIFYLSRIRGFSQISVCEDVTEHYEYWKTHVNANPDDCCNLSVF